MCLNMLFPFNETPSNNKCHLVVEWLAPAQRGLSAAHSSWPLRCQVVAAPGWEVWALQESRPIPRPGGPKTGLVGEAAGKGKTEMR